MLLLHVLQGPDRGRQFELPSNEPQLIGRSTEALPITDTTVSRRHAELTPDDGVWYLRDLESANGTFLNGEQIFDRHKLQPGDQIRCGATIFSFATAPDRRKNSPITMMDDDTFDVTIEQRHSGNHAAPAGIDPNEESMVLASPDPAAAAREHLRIVYELAAVTSGAIDREQMLSSVMDLIFEQFTPDRGFILLQSSVNEPPEPAAVRYRQTPRTIDEGRIPVSRTIIHHVISHGEGVLSTNAMNDKRFSAGDSVQSYGIRSAVCAPIRAGARILGVIHIDSQLANFTFTDAQLQLLSAVGRYVGLALSNIELIGEHLQSERLAAVGEAMASLSHSIKNILQGLRGGADAVELAINRGDLELAKQGWPILSRNLDRIFNLTLNMLAYSRKPTLDIELLPLSSLVNDVTELMQPQCDAARVGLILDVDDDMPPVPFDANAMHQALMNLLTNALEASPAKTGIITLGVHFDAAAHEAIVSVADNGPGIPDAIQREAFEAFVSTKGQRGTGLGLAVTRKIVEEHAGRITMESSHQTGTRVTIHLPSDHLESDSGATHLPRPMPASGLDDDDF